MNINWYPGHMKKTKESLEKQIGMVDVVIELLDARAPISSKNPIIDEIVRDKPRIVVLTKSDLADPEKNKIWSSYYRERDIDVLLLNSTNRKDINELIRVSSSIHDHKKARDEEKGILNRPTRAMIVGIPNVGKSTIINSISGRKGARVGNTPGVTKSNQWIKTDIGLELLDTPGILWPKFEDQKVGLHLAFIGSIKDNILDIETLALRLIEYLLEIYPEKLEERYGLDIEDATGLEVMEEIGRKRGCIISRGEIDYTRVSNLILDEFRKGTLGRLTLELPED